MVGAQKFRLHRLRGMTRRVWLFLLALVSRLFAQKQRRHRKKRHTLSARTVFYFLREFLLASRRPSGIYVALQRLARSRLIGRLPLLLFVGTSRSSPASKRFFRSSTFFLLLLVFHPSEIDCLATRDRWPPRIQPLRVSWRHHRPTNRACTFLVYRCD